MIKFVYKLFLGVLLATTIGMGIATFYTSPKAPAYPDDLATYSSSEPTPAQQKKYDRQMQKYNRDYERFEDLNKDYQRNVSIIAIALSIVILIVSLVTLAKIDILADGMLLGGILTLLYAIIASFWTEDQKFIFVATLIGLIVALALGYIKFVKPEQKQKPSRSKRKK